MPKHVHMSMWQSPCNTPHVSHMLKRSGTHNLVLRASLCRFFVKEAFFCAQLFLAMLPLLGFFSAVLLICSSCGRLRTFTERATLFGRRQPYLGSCEMVLHFIIRKVFQEDETSERKLSKGRLQSYRVLHSAGKLWLELPDNFMTHRFLDPSEFTKYPAYIHCPLLRAFLQHMLCIYRCPHA